jgi:hypothetical protein
MDPRYFCPRKDPSIDLVACESRMLGRVRVDGSSTTLICSDPGPARLILWCSPDSVWSSGAPETTLADPTPARAMSALIDQSLLRRLLCATLLRKCHVINHQTWFILIFSSIHLWYSTISGVSPLYKENLMMLCHLTHDSHPMCSGARCGFIELDDNLSFAQVRTQMVCQSGYEGAHALLLL